MTGRAEAAVTGRAVAALTTLGTLLLGAAAAIDLGNAEPRAELAVGAAGSIVFLLAAVPGSGSRRGAAAGTPGGARGEDAPALAARSRLFAGAGLCALLAVAAHGQTATRVAAVVPLLLVPAFLLVAAVVLARESALLRRRVRRRELRSRLAGEEAERRHWARELHDDTLQELAAVQLLLGVAGAGTDPAARARAIEQAGDCVGRQIAALRRLIGHLRPLALDTAGLVPAVEELARRGARPGLAIEVHAEPLPRLPTETETAAYRIVQEAVTNAVRHAGASRITVEACALPDAVVVTVRDNGRGRAAALPAGFGTLGMRERAEAIGAALSVTARDGVEVCLRMPLAAPAPLPAAAALTLRRAD